MGDRAKDQDLVAGVALWMDAEQSGAVCERIRSVTAAAKDVSRSCGKRLVQRDADALGFDFSHFYSSAIKISRLCRPHWTQAL